MTNVIIPRNQMQSHAERVRAGHRNAVAILTRQAEKTFGYEQSLLLKTADYHLMRLHHQWFGNGRRENESVR